MHRRAFLASLASIPFSPLASSPRDHGPQTPDRVGQFIAEERAQIEYIGAIPGDFTVWFYYRDRRNPLSGYLTGHQTEILALNAIENSVAGRVLYRLNIDNTSCDDLSLWLSGFSAERIVSEIISRRVS